MYYGYYLREERAWLHDREIIAAMYTIVSKDRIHGHEVRSTIFDRINPETLTGKPPTQQDFDDLNKLYNASKSA